MHFKLQLNSKLTNGKTFFTPKPCLSFKKWLFKKKILQNRNFEVSDLELPKKGQG